MMAAAVRQVTRDADSAVETQDQAGRRNAALSYAKRGWLVFPLFEVGAAGACACGDAACKSPGKHPRVATGLKTATTDARQIDRWWTAWPDANIGIVTGEASDLAVLDIDGAEGEASLKAYEDEHGVLPATLGTATGNGRHLLFRYPKKGLKTTTSIGCKGSRLDSRADGGYIVGAGSQHYSGRFYEWLEPEASLAEMPMWLCALINRPKSNVVALVRSNDASAVVPSSDPNAIPEGERNSTLLSKAGSMLRRDMSRQAILSALIAENEGRCTPPLGSDEVVAIVESIFRYASNSDPIAIGRTLNDAGNAERLIKTAGADLRYVAGQSTWLWWNGRRWRRDATAHIREIAKTVARSIYSEAAACGDDRLAKALERHASGSLQATKLRAMVEVAQSDPAVLIQQEDLDRDPWILGVGNGLLDLRTRVLRQPVQSSLVLRYSDVLFEPGARCPAFLGFLHTIFGGQQDLIDYMQRIFGYCLTGSITEQCLFFLYGTGGNGKSTLTGVISDLLGDYALQAPSEMLIQKKARGNTNDLARLVGARAVISSEVEDGSFFAETLVKELTGGDKITARFLYGEYFEFRPQFKLLVSGNHKPVIRGADEGIWRRIHLIPFEVTIPAAKRDKGLIEKLRAELPGILNWALEGLGVWVAQGLKAPAAVRNAVQEYREDMDLLGKWIAERCEVGPAHESRADALYASHSVWCNLSGQRVPSMTTFGRKLSERFQKQRTADGQLYLGLRVNPKFRANGGIAGCRVV